jgi:WG repeat protein
MPFSEGLAHVVIQEPGGQLRSCYIDHAGVVNFEAPYDHCDQFHEGFAGVEYDGKRGYIDSRGVLVIGTGLDGGFHFSEGRAAVCVGKRWGFIDCTGTFVIEPRFPQEIGEFPPGPFRDGLACVRADDGYGFIDRAGELVLRPRFRVPASFEGGVAGGPKQGYIDRTGHFLWRPGNS